MPEIQKLLIVSHVRHYRHNGRLYAYAPYAREIDIWADLFPEVRIAAPCVVGLPPGDCAAFTRNNIDITPVRETGGSTVLAKLAQIVALPSVLWTLRREMRRAQAIHVRCPGNLGLLGVLMAPLYSRYLIAKYAGQWGDFSSEPRSVRWQKRLLSSSWWKGPTTVYGKYENQTPKIVTFFTSVLNLQQVRQARESAARPRFQGRIQILFVGRLSSAKNPKVVLETVANLVQLGIDARAMIVGDGPELSALEALSKTLGVKDQVQILGGLPFEEVLPLYSKSDALVLASETEGWPKVVAEAMAFGLVCIASNRGFLREMLGDRRGILVNPGDSRAVTEALQRILNNPDECAEMRQAASEWGCRCSLEGLRDALAALLSKEWRVPLSSGTAQARVAES